MSRSLRWLVGTGGLLLLINTAYLASAASPTVFYMANVLGHLVLGAAVWVLAWALVARDPEWRGSWPARAAMACLTIAVGFAAVLLVRGNLLEHRWALSAHIGAGAAAGAAALPLAWAALRARAAGRERQWGGAFVAAAILAAVVPAAAAVWTGRGPDAAGRIVNPPMPPMSMHEEGAGAGSPFFPSSARTDVGHTIPSDFFMDSAVCGECHADIYEQWNGSAHHFASFNNQFYRKSIEYMQSVVGTEPSKWCAGCHDHAVFFNGRFDRPIKEQIDTPEARAGLACTSCHSIASMDGSMGNAGFTIAYPPLHELASSRNPVIRVADRFLTYLDPEPHRKTFAVHARGRLGVLRGVPQGAPRRARQRLPLDARVQRLRQLAGQRRVGPGRALLLLPRQILDLRGLPHAEGGLGRSRPPRRRNGPLPPLPRRQHRAALRQQGRGADEDHPGLPDERLHQRGHLRRLAGGRARRGDAP
ncbi:MAG: multiheme c-type cytochrome [Vicinamibacterales bacterium]